MIKNIKSSTTVHLDSGWRITQRRVSNEQRIEVVGPDYLHSDLLVKKGLFIERIGYETRYFIPIEKDTAKIMDEVFKISPVCRVEHLAAKSNSFVVEKKQPTCVRAKGKPSIIESLKAAKTSIKTMPNNSKDREISL